MPVRFIFERFRALIIDLSRQWRRTVLGGNVRTGAGYVPRRNQLIYMVPDMTNRRRHTMRDCSNDDNHTRDDALEHQWDWA